MASTYLIKGDISGIQNFIFNVQSKSAAKTLKAKSFFIESIGWLAEEKIKEIFPTSLCNYNGGGNFYIEIDETEWDEDKFFLLQIKFQNAFRFDSINLGLSFVKCEDEDKYAMWLFWANQVSGKTKLSMFNGHTDVSSFFQPFADQDKNPTYGELGLTQSAFKKFTSTLARSKSFSIEKDDIVSEVDKFDTYTITENSIALFGYKLRLNQNIESKSKNLFQKLPLWKEEIREKKYQRMIANRKEKEGTEFEMPREGMLIEFGYLADFAKERTGTHKLGILKLDIDNLGGLFQVVKEKTHNKRLSEKLVWFFNDHLDELLDREFTTFIRKTKNEKDVEVSENAQISVKNGTTWTKQPVVLKKVFDTSKIISNYRQNLYIVFAGGDDCFLIGAWDAVIEFAILLQTEFVKFESEQLRKDIPELNAPITLSASILIVDPGFPVVKVADMAEDELHKAKHNLTHHSQLDASGRPMKSSISFLGKIFTWKEFSELTQVKSKFLEMIIRYGEGKAFLQRIMDSFENEDTYYWQVRAKPFDPALLWRFLYHYRDIRYKDYFNAKFYNYFFGEMGSPATGGIYKKYLYDVFNEEKELSHVLPVAARWADFLTRKNQSL